MLVQQERVLKLAQILYDGQSLEDLSEILFADHAVPCRQRQEVLVVIQDSLGGLDAAHLLVGQVRPPIVDDPRENFPVCIQLELMLVVVAAHQVGDYQLDFVDFLVHGGLLNFSIQVLPQNLQ